MVALVTAFCGGSPSASESQRPVHFSGLSGVRHVVLIGASQGAKARVLAAARAPAGVVGVVSLSAERYAERRDVLPSARRLDLPALFVTGRSDPFSAADTPRLERAAASSAKRLLVVPGAARGVDLTADDRVRNAVLGFARARARAGAG